MTVDHDIFTVRQVFIHWNLFTIYLAGLMIMKNYLPYTLQACLPYILQARWSRRIVYHIPYRPNEHEELLKYILQADEHEELFTIYLTGPMITKNCSSYTLQAWWTWRIVYNIPYSPMITKNCLPYTLQAWWPWKIVYHILYWPDDHEELFTIYLTGRWSRRIVYHIPYRHDDHEELFTIYLTSPMTMKNCLQNTLQAWWLWRIIYHIPYRPDNHEELFTIYLTGLMIMKNYLPYMILKYLRTDEMWHCHSQLIKTILKVILQ